MYKIIYFSIFMFCLNICSAQSKSDKGPIGNILLKANVLDVDGNSYTPITIGTQTWLKENMKAVHYPDSTLIPDATGYNNSDSMANIYGRLYTWTAAMKNSTVEKAQGICPNGWHIPSDLEWKTLENYLGGASVAGGKMKDTASGLWKVSATSGASNSSGFSLLPGGEYDANEFKKYQLIGEYGVLWTSTIIGTTKARERYIAYDSPLSGIYDWYRIMKYSVRCIKDVSTGINNEANNTPAEYELSQNFPNPFNPETTISYMLPYDSSVRLEVFNTIGQKVKTLVNEVKSAGKYSVSFNAGGLSSGVYFCKITAGSNGSLFSDIKKLILMK